MALCCADFYKTISAIKCRTLMQTELFELWIPEFDSNGVANKISIADAKLIANWILKFNSVEATDKFYVLPLMDNITDERGDATFETLDSGRNIKTKQGDRAFEGFFIEEVNCILSELEEWEKAGSWGKFVVDKDGNILYRFCANEPNEMFPIMIDDGSLDATLMKPTYSTTMKHKVKYTYRQDEKDGDIRVLPVGDLDFNPITDPSFKGLVNIESTFSSITSTTFTGAFADCTGCPLEGLVLSDFKLFDTATELEIVITSVTEGVAGVYAFVIPLTAGAVLRLEPLKTGYNFSAVFADLITTP